MRGTRSDGATLDSPLSGGRPRRRGSGPARAVEQSTSPSRRQRPHHLYAVCREIPSSSATCATGRPCWIRSINNRRPCSSDVTVHLSLRRLSAWSDPPSLGAPSIRHDVVKQRPWMEQLGSASAPDVQVHGIPPPGRTVNVPTTVRACLAPHPGNICNRHKPPSTRRVAAVTDNVGSLFRQTTRPFPASRSSRPRQPRALRTLR